MTGGRLFRITVAASVLLLLLMVVPLPSVEGGDDRVTEVVELSYPAATLQRGDFDRISVAGLEQSRMDDAPYPLPVERLELSLDDGTIEDLRVEHVVSDPVDMGVVDLPMLVLNDGTPHGDGDASTSHVNVNGVYERRGENILALTVSPVVYDPVSKRAEHVTEITLVISYRVVTEESGPSPLSTPYDLLILTAPDLEAEMDRLADWKEGVGIDVTVVNTTAAVGGGSVNAAALKSYINDEYNQSSISYVLLAGDDDDIPAWYVTLTAGSETMPIPSDLYYGTFNYAVDWTSEIYPIADVAVGRVPLTDVSAAATWVDKVISYESREENAYLEEALFIGEQLDEEITWGGDIKDSVEVYMPSSYNVTKLYERDEGTLSFSDVQAAIADGVHVLNNVGHGNTESVAKIDSSNAQLIEAPSPFIWYSQSCYAGAFDQVDAVSSLLLGDDNNTLSMAANSRLGWYYLYPNHLEGPSNKFDKAFMDRLFDEGLLLGDVHQLSKESLVAELTNEYMLWSYTELNLLGDPTLKLGGYEEPPMSPLRIDDDTELITAVDDQGWSGEGTAGDPYLIEAENIRGTGPAALYIGNTTYHLRIVNNSIRQSLPTQTGIHLYNVVNVVVDGNDVAYKGVGIRVSGSDGIVVGNNTLSENTGAILVDGSSDCTVQHNRLVRGNDVGIALTGDSASVVANNTVSRCAGPGISVDGTGVTVTDNALYLNNGSSFASASTPQAENSGANDWDGNFWFLHDGGAYSMVGATDNLPLAEDPMPVPQFDTTSLDAMQGDEVVPSTVLDFTASSTIPVDAYMLSIDGDVMEESTASFTVGSLGLSSGMHNLTMVAFTGIGNAEYYTLEVDYAVADVSVTITAPSDYSVDNDRVTVRWTSDDSSNVSHYLVRIDSGDFVNVGTSTRYTTPSLAEGEHLILVRAVGFDGNNVSASKQVFVDTISPTLSLSGIEDGQVFEDNQVPLQWTASDPSPSSGLSHFTLRIGGSTTITIDDPDARQHLTMPLAEGGHQVTLRAYDGAGNYAQRVVDIVVDTLCPSIVFEDGPDHPYYGEDMTVQWSVTDEGSGVHETRIRINGGEWTNVTGAEEHTFEGLQDGYYEVEIRSTDVIGNTATNTSGRVVSTQDAVLDFINPHNGGYSQSPDTFTWNVWDKRGYTYTYEYSVNGSAYVSTGATPSVDLTLSNGPHNIQVRATCDQTGSVLSRAVSFITMSDAQPPSSTSPSQGEEDFLFDQPLTATFDLAMLIDKELTTTTLTDSGGSTVEGQESWSGGTLMFVPQGGLEHPGDYTWRIDIVDLAGNELSYPVAFSVKNVTLPGAPIGLTASHVPGWDGVSISLDWEEPTDDGGYPQNVTELQYNVYRRSNQTDFAVIATVTDTEYEDSSVTWDDYYIYYVTAVNPVGEGPASDIFPTGLPQEPGTLEKLSLFLDHIGEILGETWDMLVENWDMFVDTVADAWDGLVASAQDALDATVQALGDAADAIVAFGEDLYDATLDGFDTLGDWIVEALDLIGQGVVDLVDYVASTEGTERLVVAGIIILFVVLLYLLIRPSGKPKERRATTEEEYVSPYARRRPKPEAVETSTDMPRTLEATLATQNGILIAEEIKELEAAYAEGLVGWQEYEAELLEKSSRLTAITLASYYVQMGEDLY